MSLSVVIAVMTRLLFLPFAARGFVTVARATRFDLAVAGGQVEFDSAFTRAAFARLFDVV